MKRSDEIRTRHEQIRSDLTALQNKDNPTEDDHLRSDALLEEFDELADELKPLAERESRIAAVRSASQSPASVERGAPELVVRNSNLDPYENPVAIRQGMLSSSDYRARALVAVEQAAKSDHLAHDHAEAATQKLEKLGNISKRNLAQHVLTTGAPEYKAAFEEWVSDPETFGARAAMSLTGANGGFLVPFTLDPSIILTNAGSANPYRQIATVKTTATNDWNGVSSAGVNAAWLAEATEAADSSPTVAQLKITPQKASAWVYGSYEFVEDSDFASQLPSLLADAKDRLEEAAFTTGTGSGQPKGIVTAATTTVTAGGTGAYAVADLYALQAAVPARFRGVGARPAFVMNLATINRSRQFDTAGGSSLWTNLGNGSPERVLGWPLYESTTMASALTTGTKIAIAGDFSQYYIVDRIGMSLTYDPLVKGASFRPTGQAGWFAMWRVGADAAVPGAFRTLVTG